MLYEVITFVINAASYCVVLLAVLAIRIAPRPRPDAAEAVSLVLNYITAYQMLHRSAEVRPGQRALIHGAAGGVGTALLQLGRLAGLEMS